MQYYKVKKTEWRLVRKRAFPWITGKTKIVKEFVSTETDHYKAPYGQDAQFSKLNLDIMWCLRLLDGDITHEQVKHVRSACDSTVGLTIETTDADYRQEQRVRELTVTLVDGW